GVVSEPSRRRYPVIAVKMPYAISRLPARVHATRRRVDSWWRARTIARPPTNAWQARGLLAEASAWFSTAMRYHVEATMITQAFFEQLASVSAETGHEGSETALCTGYGGLEETKVLQGIWDVSRHRIPVGELVSRFGFLGRGTGELANPSWRQDPASLDRAVEAYRNREAASEPTAVERAQAVRRHQTVADLLRGTTATNRTRIRAILALAERYVPLREGGKAAYVQVLDAGRCAAPPLGDRLVREGLRTEPTDVFYLGLDELLTECPDDLRPVVAARRVVHERFDRLDIPLNWVGAPVFDESTEPVQATAVLKGLPVCAGRVEGVVRIVSDPGRFDFVE